jgi:hypothetical protein
VAPDVLDVEPSGGDPRHGLNPLLDDSPQLFPSGGKGSWFKVGQDSNDPGVTREKPGVEQSINVKSNVVPPDLAEVVAVWRRLPDAVRVGILAIVRASRG